MCPQKCLDTEQTLSIILIPCTNKMYVFSFQNASSSILLAVVCRRRRGGQLKGVVVKQMFRPGIREGSVPGYVNFSCPRFFLLLNMNDVDGF